MVILGALILSIWVSACGDDDTLPADGVFAEVEIRYSMPDRFGLDENGNSLPDLPNTCAYVNNVTSGSCPPDEATFTLNLRSRADVLVRSGGETVERHRVRASTWEWEITGGGLTEPITYQSSSGTWSARLPEGTYDITATVDGTYGVGDSIVGTATRSITVRDLLIVSIGDSYASGEGNPERRGATSLGSLTIGGFPFDVSLNATWADDGVSAGYPALSTAQGLDHQRAHRSTISGPAQAALSIERADDRFSVTFVSLATSGATIDEGLLGPSDGKEPFLSLIYELAPLEPQIVHLADIAGNREIDFLVISIGGNDMGFANVVKALMLHGGFIDWGPSNFVCAGESDLTLCAIDGAIRSGNWNIVETAFIGGPTFDELDMKNGPGLDSLSSLYDKLNDHLADLNVGNVLITTYPDPTQIGEPGALDYCDRALGGITSLGELDQYELAWARSRALLPLNTTIIESAQAHGWTVIGSRFGIYRGHGLCGDPPPYEFGAYPGNRYPAELVPWPTADSLRWFRNARESSEIQGGERSSTLGTLHPNEFGHKEIGRLLTEHIMALIRLAQLFEG